MLRQIKISYYDGMRKQIDDFDVEDNITNKDFECVVEEIYDSNSEVLVSLINNTFPSN